jgi:GTPase SAR1 family protein
VHIPDPQTGTDSNASDELYLFDCAGQSIFNIRELSAKYWENTAFVMVVYDVSNRESFQSVTKWLQAVRSVRPNTGYGPMPGVLVANKVDLRSGGINSRAVVDTNEGVQLAQQSGLECEWERGRERSERKRSWATRRTPDRPAPAASRPSLVCRALSR